MDSANIHHLHLQLQDQLASSSSSSSSSSLATPFLLGISTTQSSTPYITSSSFNFHGQRKDIANLECPNTSLVQEMGNFQSVAINDHWRFINQSPHLSDQNIKEEVISNHYLKFTETSNSSNSSSTVDDFQFPSSKNEPTNNLHDLTEKLLLNTLSSGCQINGNDQIKIAEFYPNSHNFSQIYPSINLASWNQSPPARYEDGFSHSSENHPFFPEKMQESRLLCGGNKMSSTRMGNQITEAKRASTFMNMMKTAQTSLKKTRLESRASCPPFKVRKEKLGERISALQQLVAPFGKTDTASVLMEAIGYIKFLQNQVETLSVPYMKPLRNKTRRGVHGVQLEYGNEEPRRDLKSRGLCLVPLACMSYLTGESGCYGGGVLPPPFG